MSSGAKYWVTQAATGAPNQRYYVCDDSSTGTSAWTDSRQKSTKELLKN